MSEPHAIILFFTDGRKGVWPLIFKTYQEATDFAVGVNINRFEDLDYVSITPIKLKERVHDL